METTNFTVYLTLFYTLVREGTKENHAEIVNFIKKNLDLADGLEAVIYLVIRYFFAPHFYHYDYTENILHVNNRLRARTLLFSLPPGEKELSATMFLRDKTSYTLPPSG